MPKKTFHLFSLFPLSPPPFPFLPEEHRSRKCECCCCCCWRSSLPLPSCAINFGFPNSLWVGIMCYIPPSNILLLYEVTPGWDPASFLLPILNFITKSTPQVYEQSLVLVRRPRREKRHTMPCMCGRRRLRSRKRSEYFCIRVITPFHLFPSSDGGGRDRIINRNFPRTFFPIIIMWGSEKKKGARRNVKSSTVVPSQRKKPPS